MFIRIFQENSKEGASINRQLNFLKQHLPWRFSIPEAISPSLVHFLLTFLPFPNSPTSSVPFFTSGKLLLFSNQVCAAHIKG